MILSRSLFQYTYILHIEHNWCMCGHVWLKTLATLNETKVLNRLHTATVSSTVALILP